MSPREVGGTLDTLPREEWLALRRQGIGSSDVAGICGYDRFNAPLPIWLDKIGEGTPEPENVMMRMGRRLEPVVAAEFEEVTGLRTAPPTAMYASSEYPFMLASPDRWVGEHGSQVILGVLEIKTGRNEDIWGEGPPTSVVLQATHQMIVTERREAWIAVLLNGRNFDHWHLDRNDDLCEQLIKIETEFWQRVVDRDPPPADGHEATTEALKQLYRVVDPGEKVDLTDLRPVLDELELVKEREKAVGVRRAELENQLRERFGKAEIGLVNGTEAVTWKAASAIDIETFRTEEPDLFEAFRVAEVDLGRLKKERPDLDKRFRKEHAGSRRLIIKKGAA